MMFFRSRRVALGSGRVSSEESRKRNSSGRRNGASPPFLPERAMMRSEIEIRNRLSGYNCVYAQRIFQIFCA
jgi:hypothetical protein